MSEHKCGPACIVAVDIERAARTAQPTAKSIADVHAADVEYPKAMQAAFETACVALATGASILRRLDAPMDLIAAIVSASVTAGVTIAGAELRVEAEQQEAPADKRKVH